jgi:A/G-specific adenine glycosylase
MLQQTTVATVTPRFALWMRRFPGIDSLAEATEEDVLAAWEGLGYYSRARRLHAAAQAVMERHAGVIPRGEKDLLALPGVGDYTAAAVRAFAFDERAVVLDTNIIRVLARWDCITAPVDMADGKKMLRKTAEDFFPDKGCRAAASALMDLGATLCTAGKPDCAACPLQKTCLAGSPERLPAKSPRRVTAKASESRAWYLRGGRLYLQQSGGPRWKGLWILPELKHGPAGRALAELTYPITRYRITMKVRTANGSIPPGLKGFAPDELGCLPIPSPHRRAIAAAFRAIAVQ